METQTRARHRLGGKHSDPIIVPTDMQKKPSGRRSAVLHPVEQPKTEVIVPPKPSRAPTVRVEPVSVKAQTGRIRVVKHKEKLTALAAITTGGMLLLAGGAVTGFGAKEAKASGRHAASSASSVSDLEYESAESNPITASVATVLVPEKVEVQTIAAPVEVKVEAVEVVEPEPVIVEEAAVVVARHVAPVTVPVSAPAVIAPPSVDLGRAGMIAAAAKAQLGRTQDCTMLVTNALAQVGIQHHGWPVSYHSLGYTVSPAEAIPGDLVYYAAQNGMPDHIAVYIGNGQAVHGGWNGNQTIIFSVNVGWPSFPPTSYIRVR